MTVSLVSGSNVQLVTGTETTLTNVGSPGLFQLVADLTNFAANDGIELRGKMMVTPTGTARVVEFASYSGTQPATSIVKLLPPIPNDQTDGNALIFTATQTVGAGRNLLWKVVNLEDNASKATVDAIAIEGQVILDYVSMLAMDDHAVTGLYFYVEATNGSDVTGDGSRTRPYQTITKALSMTQAYRHDAVLLMPNPSGTVNTYQEASTIVLNKAYVQIIGVGSDILVKPTAGGGKDVFSITANGVGLHQMTISTNGNTSNGVTVSNGVQEAFLHLVHIEDCSQDGILLNVATNCMVLDCHVLRAGRDGIRINSGAGAGNYNTIERSVVRACTVNGINLLGVDASNTRIQYCVVRGNGVGINVAAGTVASIIVDNRILDNTVDYVDAGTTTHQEWNWFSTDTFGRVNTVYNLVSGTSVVTGVIVDYGSVWNYAPRTLTSQVFSLPPVFQSNNLNVVRGDTFVWAPINLGSLANLSKLYFTIKRRYTDPDTEAEVQIEKTAGLIYINRGPATTAVNGSIVVNSLTAGNITITLAAAETAKLDILQDVYYDVQFINSSGTVTTLVAGLVTIAGDATRGTTP